MNESSDLATEVAAKLNLGNDALIVTGIYLLGMLTLGLIGRLSRKEESLRDFYLGGSSFGLAILFLTFFATQYSGNTLLGFAGSSYRQGGVYVVSITFMVLVITVYMIYAPRLFRLSRRFGYITPADYVFHRFGSHKLRVLTVVLLCWGLANYVLEQLVAMGHSVVAISGGRIEFMYGVVGLVAVMLVYESLGGMRSVAWTDAVQGTLLFFGCGVILYMLMSSAGGLAAATERIAEIEPKKLQAPGAAGVRKWISTLIVLALGVSIYPHAIQRIFSARSLGTLRRSLTLMAFMPLVTTFLAFLIGFVGLSRYAGLSGAESDKITIYVMSDIIGSSVFMHWLVVIVFAAILAAIMSTADSALLSIGSMFTKDIYKVYLRPDAQPTELLRVGKLFAWGVMAFLIFMAWVSLETKSSIWFLIRLKLEFMAQLSPVFVLGVFWKRLPASAAFLGMLSGTVVAMVMWVGAMKSVGWFDSQMVWNVHPGVWGLILNYGICIGGGLMAPAPDIPAQTSPAQTSPAA